MNFRKQIYLDLYLLLSFFGCCLWLPNTATAQYTTLSSSENTFQIAAKAVNRLYNWEFAETEKLVVQLESVTEKHPAVPFIRAMSLFWQHFPIQENSKAYEQHIDLLEKTVALASQRLSDKPNDREAFFFKMTARSLVMRHLANFGHSMRAVGAAKDVYGMMMDASDWRTEYVEFYLIAGLYNYYREYYPEKHPVYQPFAFFFRSGDKKEGIEQLKYAAKHGTFTKPESLAYLSLILFKYENKASEALVQYWKLSTLFPNNLLYASNYSEALILNKQYDQAQRYVDLLDRNSTHPYFKLTGIIFKGMLKEYQQKNIEAAFQNYQQAEKLVHQYTINPNLKTYIYTGMAHYYLAKEDLTQYKHYLKLAKKTDEYGFAK